MIRMNKFIDVCFPKNNESSFIELAKKIKTDGLVFVYDKKNYKKKEYEKSENIDNEKIKIYKFFFNKDIFLFNENYKNRLCIIDESFKFPKNLNHVFVKKIKENNIVLGISYKILKNNINELNRLFLFLRLCKKYNVNLFPCSLAKNIYELKEKRQHYAFLRVLTKDTYYSKKCVFFLNNYLNIISNK